MRKLLKWLDKYLLEIGIIFLSVFIPLYPKFPLIDLPQTWVYIRLEDFLVALVVLAWLILLVRKRVSLSTPLTLPILSYWLAGALSLVFAVVFLRTQIPHFFPGLAALHFFRRVEYMILFFIAFSVVKDLAVVRRYLFFVILTFIGVCLYGFGQKFLGLPAFLTMNEEFAKGLPLYLPPTARMTSTFAGHYDLAAYLVLMISFLGSLIFGFKNWLAKVFILGVTFAGFILLLFTASRVSFAVYLLSVTLMLVLQKKKWLIIPFIIVSIYLANFVTGSSERFAKTFRVRQVVYDSKTGLPIATVEDFFISPTPTPPLVVARKVAPPPPVSGPPPAEENLPLGSGFIDLGDLTREEALAQIIKRPIITSSLQTASVSSQIATESGEFLIKRTIVYDISFTTRIQGEWPRALEAFRRNYFLGSGFSSISLATDNDYLRALGETGLLGFLAFGSVLVAFALLIRQGLRKIPPSLSHSVLIGTTAGLLGLLLNAVLIDVFEASKVAYVFWLLLGVTVGVAKLALPKDRPLWKEAVEIAQMPLTAMVGLGIVAFLVLGSSISNYFTGDDFTWLRWAVTSRFSDIGQFFVSAGGFFYRPLAKIYFLLANPLFELRPQGYHLVSFLLHFGTAIGAYLLTLLLTKKKLVACLAGLLFLIHPINAESIFWVSCTSQLFASLFYLWGFIGWVAWRKINWRGRPLFFFLALLAFVLSLLSHEKAVTFPLIILFYDVIFYHSRVVMNWAKRVAPYLPFWVLLTAYFWIRTLVSHAHGLSGDYSYSFKNLIFNLVGNFTGYLGEAVFSFNFIPLYDLSRDFLRSQKLVAVVALLVSVLLIAKLSKYLRIREWWQSKEFKLAIFCLGWFIILLLPFLGLGNIAKRYLHTALVGFVIVLALLINLIFEKLKTKGLVFGVTAAMIILIGIVGFYLKEMKQAQDDWHQAGETANKILLAMATNYEEFPASTSLYFVNLPLRQNRAWIFPVGLKDGLWFIYRDDSLKIYQLSDVEEALDLAEGKPSARVFPFENGGLKEASR